MKLFRRMIAALMTVCLLAGAGLVEFSTAVAEMIPSGGTSGEITSGDGWIYRLSAEGDAILTGSTDPGRESVILPKSVDGHWAVAVGENAFADHTEVRRLRVPASFSRLPGSAFANANGMTVEAYNGSAALAFAKQRGFRESNLSEYDFHDDVLDMSEISSSQFSFSGSTLTVNGPWVYAVKEGGRIYLPPHGSYRNGIPLEVDSVTASGGSAVARVSKIEQLGALKSYHVENEKLYPDWSRAVMLTDGVRPVGGRAGAKRSHLEPMTFELKDIPIAGKWFIDGSLTIRDFDVDVSLNWTIGGFHSLSIICDRTCDIDFTVKNRKYEKQWPKESNKEQETEVTLMKIPVYGVTLVSLWVEVTAKFTVDGTYTLQFHVQKSNSLIFNGKGLQVLSPDPIRSASLDSAIKAEFEIRAALKAYLGFVGLDFCIAEVGAAAGLEAKVEHGGHLLCFDVDVDFYAKIDAAVHLGGADFVWTPLKRTFDLWDSHFELDKMAFMDKCSYLDDYVVVLETGCDPPEDFETVIAVPQGTSMQNPGAFERYGYFFRGWYTDQDYTTRWNFDQLVWEDMTLYARWERNAAIDLPPPDPELDLPVLIPVPEEDYLVWEYDTTCSIYGIKRYNPGYIEDWNYLCIPSEINGKTVTSIGVEAFKGCYIKPVAVYIPDTVTWISAKAFMNCRELKSVTMGNGVETIGFEAFKDCRNLMDIELPDSVKEIGKDALSGCESLMRINVPASLETTGTGWFYAPNIKWIDVPAGMEQLPEGVFALESAGSLDATIPLPVNLQAIPDRAFKYLSLPKLDIPEKVESIGEEAFAYSTVPELTVPESVQTIGKSAFEHCGMEYITLKEGLKTIEDYAFSNCDSLIRLDFPASLEYLGYAPISSKNLKTVTFPKNLEGYHELQDLSPWRGCPALKEIILPEGMETLFDGALENAPIKRITLPSSMRVIGERVFDSCTNLTEVNLNDGLEEIGFWAFYGCTALENLDLPSSLRSIKHYAFEGCALQRIELPEGMVSLTESALRNCAGLKEAILPASLKTIGEYAFYQCPLEHVQLREGLESIGAYAFYHCPLQEIRLPEGLQSIGDYAFDRTTLPAVHFPDSLTQLGNYSFAHCEELLEMNYPRNLRPDVPVTKLLEDSYRMRKIVIPEGVTAIPEGIFAESSIETVILPSSLETIGDGAFSGSWINAVTIPAGVTDMGVSFTECQYLQTVLFQCTDEVWSAAFAEGCFAGSDIRRILVPDLNSEAVLAFRAAYPGIRVEELSNRVYNIVFLSGDDVLDSRMARSGSLVPSVGKPVKPGFIFVGWYREPECRTLWDFAADRVGEQDLCLYAGWEVAGDSFIYEETADAIRLVGYIGNIAEIRIPREVNGKPVTALGAFFLEDGVTRVIIPPSVTEIDAKAFCLAEDLAEIAVDEGSRFTAEDGVLFDGTALIVYPAARPAESYTVPETTTAIRRSDFTGCSSLRELEIGEGVRTLGEYAVYRCPQLRAVSFSADPEGIGKCCFWNCGDAALTGPISAEVLETYCSDNMLDYNLFTLTYMRGEETLAKVRARAGMKLQDFLKFQESAASFRGWSRNPDGSDPWDMENDRMPAENLALYGVWAYDFEAETVDGGLRLSRYTGDQETVHVPEEMDGVPVIAIAEDCFGSLSPLLCGNKGSVTEAFAVQYEYRFSPYTYEVIFETNGGTPEEPLQLAATEAVELPQPVKTGFALTGWYTDAELTAAWTDADRMPAADLTLYAGWIPTNPDAREPEYTCEAVLTGLVITGYIGNADTIAIPEELNGQPVVAIAPGAFESSRLLEVMIPDSVISIGERAFQNCRSLRTVRLPAGLTTLEARTFAGCQWLKDVTMPNDLRRVGDAAFANCGHLQEISLGNMVEEIAETAFRGCGKLASVTAGGQYYSSVDGVLFSADGSMLILYPEGKPDTDYTVPDGVYTIFPHAMAGCRARTVRFCGDMVSVGDYALERAQMLTAVVMNEGLDEIGEGAFAGCASLREAELPDSVTYVGARTFHQCPLNSLTVGMGTGMNEDCVDATDDLTIFGWPESPAADYAASHGIRFVNRGNAARLEGLALPETLVIRIAENEQLVPVLTPENAPADGLTWRSDNEAVAVVDGDGWVSGRSAGTAVITVTGAAGVKASCVVTVKYPTDTNWELELPEVIRVRVGKTETVMISGEMPLVNEFRVESADDIFHLMLSVEDDSVAVCVNGCVLGISPGTTWLRARRYNESNTVNESVWCLVEVLAPYAMGTPDFVLPESLREIEAGAFAGVRATVVRIPELVESIGDGAFADCASLVQIYIPESCDTFGNGIFTGCGSDLVIFCKEGSPAQSYAEANGIPYYTVR